MNLSFVRKLRSFSAFTIAIGSAGIAAAFTPADIQVHGFISQGYVENWGNNVPFEAKGGTFDYREMAINASYATGNVRIGAQAYAQRLGNYGEDKPILDWAIVDYSFNRSIGVRAGRVKMPKGLYGEALDVDAIRPFASLPSSLYSSVLRDFSSSFDGGMVYGNLELGTAGSLDYKVFYGDIRMDGDQGVADYFNTTSIFASDINDLGMNAIWGGQLNWNTPVLGLRLAYSFNQINDLYGTGPLNGYPIVDASLLGKAYDTHILSAEYFYHDWTFAAEVSVVGGLFEVSSPFGTVASDAETINWYVSAARRINDRLELGAYYSVQENDNAAPGTPNLMTYYREWVASARYDISDRWLAKVEGHFGKGLYNVFNTARTPNPSMDDTSTALVLKTTFVF